MGKKKKKEREEEKKSEPLKAGHHFLARAGSSAGVCNGASPDLA